MQFRFGLIPAELRWFRQNGWFRQSSSMVRMVPGSRMLGLVRDMWRMQQLLLRRLPLQ
jgi:hypothetical protein